ncbi:MAG: DNA polymerase I [bacterium]
MSKNSKAETNRFVAIDANSLIHRAFHAFPATLATSDGTQVNAVYGFTSMFLKVLKDLDPKYIVCAFDLKGPTVRHTEFTEYKAHRKPTDKELVDQFPVVKDVVRAFNIPILEHKGYEADDVLGTISEYVKSGVWSSDNLELVIVTGDKDLFQLVDGVVKVWLPQGNFKNVKMYGGEDVVERMGVTPGQIVDFKALIGDASDNIPGVKGIGEKTAQQLLAEHKTLDGIYKNIDKIKPRIAEILKESEEVADLSRRLARIITDVDLDVRLEDCLMRDFNYQEVMNIFQKLEFRSLVSKIPKTINVDTGDQIGFFAKPQGNLDDIGTIADIKNKKNENFGISYFDNGSVVAGIGGKSKEYFWQSDINLRDFEKLIDIMESSDSVIFSGFEKFCKDSFALGLDLEYKKKLFNLAKNKVFDIGIAAYFLSTSKKDYSLRALAFTNTDIILPETGYYSKQYTSLSVDALFDVAKKLQERVIDLLEEEREFLKNVDMVLPLTTAEMSSHGILVDASRLEKKSEEMQKRIKTLEKGIYDVVGHEFNISSSRQLADVLFNELQLPAEKKTKTGFSTGEEVLKGLLGTHPCIEKVLEYREITKLKSTYIDPLIEYSKNSKDGRVHSTFNQLGTTTGRLSSNNPNLQNIPTRSDMGKEVRDMFVAPKGKKLVSIDYSQIELRIMASVSNDKNMIDDFSNSHDFHTATAIRLLGKKGGEVTKNDRRMAKIINFGVLYGMSAFGLSNSLGIEQSKAKEYIDAYFEKYSGVRDYMEEVLENARKDGYVKTLWGRRRYVQGIKSRNWRIRMATERETINLPIQGTAADIMRKAMVEVFEWILNNQDKADLLLQIHDELVFECNADDAKDISKGLSSVMNGVAGMKVPLEVEVEIADSLSQ